MKRLLLGVLLLVAVSIGLLYALGRGWLGGGPWQSPPVTAGSRPVALPPAGDVAGPLRGDRQVLFGDLHVHTSYSLDAYLFGTALVRGTGITTPADACDFARYCSALDFWSINDHAEGLTPRVWRDTLDAIRACNEQAGDPANPDLVSFVGWEWSNSDADDVPSHYGHKNVIFRTWEEGRAPTRPIASRPRYVLTRIPPVLVGLMGIVEELRVVSDFGWYLQESRDTPLCPEGVPATALPDTCREVALTPRELYRKLDEWGYDAMVIPHGLAWGTTNPLEADFRNQLDQYEQRYQNLLETYSGHGSSERFEDFQRIGVNADGSLFCPPATANFTPCCQRAGELARARCDAPDSPACAAEVGALVARFLREGEPAGRELLPEASLDDWAGCGQLRNTFQPASMYVPRQSTQYNLALGFDARGRPQRARFGLIGSGDNHQARAGTGYKETSRVLYTDTKSVSGKDGWSYSADVESGAFFYTGGLVAAYADGRDRDAIWRALQRREVYATSGDRILVRFDLLNGPQGAAPMGSEVTLRETPRFRVQALGALEQLPGCPEAAVAALGRERVASLCGGECYRPGDRRKSISRVEIVRIRPQVRADEDIAPLVEDRWRVFDCPGTGEGCTVEFEDPDYVPSARPALYYARAIEAPQALVGGDPFGCEYDGEGNCRRRHYCIGENAPADENCTAAAEPRAWTSPIFLEFPR